MRTITKVVTASLVAAEPLTRRRELVYVPEMRISRFDCDPESARRAR